jgi:hypothetical protein
MVVVAGRNSLGAPEDVRIIGGYERPQEIPAQ